MKRQQRFPIVMSEAERRVLDKLANDEMLSAASVVRRLIIREAKERGLWPPDNQHNEQAQAGQGVGDGS
jgi:RNA polymerase-interacting CarD/CdnL/TRCF family regulator